MKSVEWPSVSASRSAVRASAAAGSRCSAGSSRMRMEKSASRARATADALALAAREAGAGRSDFGGQAGGQPGEPVAQADPRQHRAAARRRSAVAPADPQVLGQASCRRGAGSARPARRPGAPRRRTGAPAARRRASPRRRRRAGSAPGRRPASTCPHRSARPAPPGGPERGRGRPRAGRLGRCRGSRPTPRAGERVGPVPSPGSGCGASGSSTGAGASMAANTRPAAVRERCSAWVAAGSGAHQLEGGQRDEGQHGQQRAVEVAGVGGAHPEGQGPPAGQPGQGGGQAEPDAGRARALAGRGPQAAVRLRRSAPPAPPVPPMTVSSGAPSIEVDHRRAQLAAGRRLARPPRAGPGGR